MSIDTHNTNDIGLEVITEQRAGIEKIKEHLSNFDRILNEAQEALAPAVAMAKEILGITDDEEDEARPLTASALRLERGHTRPDHSPQAHRPPSSLPGAHSCSRTG